MRRISKVIVFFIIVILLSSCGKKSYVVFNYNCNGQQYYKCELKKNKLNCNINTPSCEGYQFKGWYRANDYTNQVDLNGTFSENEIIYARWTNGSIDNSSSQIEPSSTIITPGIIDVPSSEQPSSSSTIIPPDEPSSHIITPQPVEETYRITFNANGGSGQPTSLIVKYNQTLPSANVKPTRTGYTFAGWYDSQSGGTQYYNSSNSSVRKYDKKSNTTLYAHWTANVLSIEYNGNGGTWNNPSKDTYSVNSSGTVILKSSGEVYYQKLNYGTQLESSGLIDYNGSWFNWKRSGYIVESGKEYIIGSTVVDQSKVYTSVDLAKYGGCDLSKNSCKITIKVNWKKQDYLPEITPLSGGTMVFNQSTDTLKVKIQRFKDKDSRYYYLTYIWVADAFNQSSKAQSTSYPNALQKTQNILEAEVNKEGLQNKLVIATNASAYYNSSYSACKSAWKRENDKAGYTKCGDGIASCFCYPARTSSEEYSKKYTNTQAGNLVITKGKVVRNWPAQEAVDKTHDLDLYGIDPAGTFRVFRNINGGTESSRRTLYQQIIDTGIKDTIVWYVPIILNGKTVGWKNNQNKNNITAFCQVNKNNFVIFSARQAVYNYLVPDSFEALGCQNAVNFDGGGSVEILYKTRGGNVTRLFTSHGDNANAEVFYFTE